MRANLIHRRRTQQPGEQACAQKEKRFEGRRPAWSSSSKLSLFGRRVPHPKLSINSRRLSLVERSEHPHKKVQSSVGPSHQDTPSTRHANSITPPSRTGIAHCCRRKSSLHSESTGTMSSSKGKPAYVDDYDEETGRISRKNRKVASSKEKPKVSQRDRETREERDARKARKPLSDTAYPGEGSSRHAPAEQVQKEVKIERRKSTSSGSSKSPRKTRPPSAHDNKNFPKISIPSSSKRDDPTNYGIPTQTTTYSPHVVSQPIPLRPRAVTTQTYPSRPLSYHAAVPGGYSRPPLSQSAFWQQPQIYAPSYPPPQSPAYMETIRYSAQPQADYFQPQPQSRPLSSRFEIPRAPSAFEPSRTTSAFDPITRTSSAFGTRSGFEQAGSYYDDAYASASEGANIRKERRGSIRVPSTGMSKAQADYNAMPPPTTTVRPGILRRPATEYRAPSEYIVEPEPQYRSGRTEYREESRTRRPSSQRHSVSYDLGRGGESVRVEAANSGRRRQSFYEPPVTKQSTGYEDKMHQAASYQEDVGGPTVPLTAETLKRQQRRQAGSSRSSHSRDESDYKKSATTRTTRSMSNDNDENVTIKVTGQARVMVGGARIDCNEGGEIQIKREKSLRNGSERSNSDYGMGRLESRSRVERDRPGRSSRSSQSGHSYTRSTPHYPMDNFI